jgi:hypothetical protein
MKFSKSSWWRCWGRSTRTLSSWSSQWKNRVSRAQPRLLRLKLHLEGQLARSLRSRTMCRATLRVLTTRCSLLKWAWTKLRTLLLRLKTKYMLNRHLSNSMNYSVFKRNLLKKEVQRLSVKIQKNIASKKPYLFPEWPSTRWWRLTWPSYRCAWMNQKKKAKITKWVKRSSPSMTPWCKTLRWTKMASKPSVMKLMILMTLPSQSFKSKSVLMKVLGLRRKH